MKRENSLWRDETLNTDRQRSAAWRWPGALRLAACGAVTLLATAFAWANGGPFVIKYPGGDPAAKGVLARLDPDLKPARETRLQVVKEDLAIRFEPDRFALRGGAEDGRNAPLVAVTAAYFITNTAAETVEVDFGFPILRGIYLNPMAMMPMPDVQVRADNTYVQAELISNSAIYGLLRRKAVAAIERAMQTDARLERFVVAVQSAEMEAKEAARQALTGYLTGTLKWTSAEAALLVEYATLGPAKAAPNSVQQTKTAAAKAAAPGFGLWGDRDRTVAEAVGETVWATQAIGEQKATQWLTLLARRVDPASANSYEAVFQAWGGDVRERSVDLNTGRIRPREITLKEGRKDSGRYPFSTGDSDSTIYARVDYLNANKNLTVEQKTSWQAVLKHLPVVFTFAPMNLLHYRVSFPAHVRRTVTVAYKQYGYLDTAAPESYQVAYVVHPASLWDSFGPIHLAVTAPEGVRPVSAIPLGRMAENAKTAAIESPGAPKLTFHSYGATLMEKRGELFIGINAEDWRKAVAPNMTVSAGNAVAPR